MGSFQRGLGAKPSTGKWGRGYPREASSKNWSTLTFSLSVSNSTKGESDEEQFTEEQIIKAITRLKNGAPAKELGRELGVSPNTLYNWRKRFKDMTVQEAKRMRELESKNARLKKLVADQALDIAMLKDVNSRKW